MTYKATTEDLKDYLIEWLLQCQEDWLDKKIISKAVAETIRDFNSGKIKREET